MEEVLTISFDQKGPSLSGILKLLFPSCFSLSDLVLFYVETEDMFGLKEGAEVINLGLLVFLDTIGVSPYVGVYLPSFDVWLGFSIFKIVLV